VEQLVASNELGIPNWQERRERFARTNSAAEPICCRLVLVAPKLSPSGLLGALSLLAARQIVFPELSPASANL